MESLHELLAAKYESARKRDLEAQKAIKKQKLEIRLKELDSKNNSFYLTNFFNLWKESFLYPWNKHIKIIVRFLRYVRFWGKSRPLYVPTLSSELQSDQEIIAHNLREYNESLQRDSAREMIPIIFWANTCCKIIPDDYILDKYVQRMISVKDFVYEMRDWPSLNTFLFWVKIHQNGNIKIPRWVGYQKKDLMMLAFSKIYNLGEEIIRYQKHQCPNCDGMFYYQDLVDKDGIKICFICNSREYSNMTTCCICSQLAETKEYDGIPLCESCARQNNVYQIEESNRTECTACRNLFVTDGMVLHPDGFYFCNECAFLAGIEMKNNEDDVNSFEGTVNSPEESVNSNENYFEIDESEDSE